jgi:hypothetical protein
MNEITETFSIQKVELPSTGNSALFIYPRAYVPQVSLRVNQSGKVSLSCIGRTTTIAVSIPKKFKHLFSIVKTCTDTGESIYSVRIEIQKWFVYPGEEDRWEQIFMFESNAETKDQNQNLRSVVKYGEKSMHKTIRKTKIEPSAEQFAEAADKLQSRLVDAMVRSTSDMNNTIALLGDGVIDLTTKDDFSQSEAQLKAGVSDYMSFRS